MKNGALSPSHSNPYEVDLCELSLLDAANLFLNYQNDIEVPSHLKKNLSKDHLDHVKSKITQFLDILEDNGFNKSTMPVVDLKDYHVGLWHEYITTNYSEGSWNTLRRIMSSWINYLIDEQGLEMRNPFSKVIFEIIECDIEAISEVEFNGVLDAIDTMSPYQIVGKKRPQRVNMKKVYLKDGIRLGLMIGLRREEVVTLSWSDIKIQHDTGKLIIVTDNSKVERIMKKKYKKTYVPVYPQLMELLVEMGYDDLKESDDYILHPERGTLKAKTMMNVLSKGFSHYFKQAFPDKKLIQFKVLRKTYMSYLNKATGDDMIDLSGHGGMGVVKKHYLDKNLTARGGDMRMF